MCGVNKEKSGRGERICPLCKGEKTVAGTCTCDMEWRGTQLGEEWNDCKCTPDEKCPNCNGTGVVTD
jgi:hypothetical protein